MAILKIRDKDGNVREVLAIRGESYVLTEQDKDEIASMISDSDGNGNFSALTDHKNNTSNPHEVTAEQLGAVTKEKLDEALANVGGGVGTTFIPSVSEDGTISWTNNGDLPNPEPVNIKGKDGNDGKNGTDGVDGKDGEDGYTPQKGIDYFDGEPGKDGAAGKDGADGVSATHSWNGTVLTVTSASGTSSANLKGEKGDTGANGYTPVKGTDYWTEADRTQMVADVIAALPVYSGEVV